MTTRPYSMLIILACAVSLTACEKSTKDAQADAVRDTSAAAGADIDNKANAVEDQAQDSADAMREKADAVRKRGEKQADAVEAGTSGATTRTDQMTTTTKPDPR